MAQNERWTYNSQEIEIVSSFKVSSFNYLGIGLSNGCSFIQATKTLADKGLKAMHCLLETIKETKAPIKIMFHLYDSLVAPVLSYGCKIWGFASPQYIERVHRKFLKQILNVKLSTNNYALYTELGRHPLG